MSQENKKSSLGDALRHPMVTMVVGFLLTGVIGTAVTQFHLTPRNFRRRTDLSTPTSRPSLTSIANPDSSVERAVTTILEFLDEIDLFPRLPQGGP